MKNVINLRNNHLIFLSFLTGLFLFSSTFTQLAIGENEYATLVNFNEKGLQITRFDSVVAAIDAHDGEIAQFDGVYYLYGTSYDCGYEWHNPNAPFCGFKVYASNDLVNWVDKGFLFDAQTEIWQVRCNGGTYGCYRPHVIYNKKNNQYVLWINSYDNAVGFHVFVSPTPIGPFTEVEEPTLAVNSDAPVRGLNNGDHDLFVDDDEVAYIAYTDWRTGGTLVIDKLNEDYTSGTGEHVKNITSGSTEAPALMKRENLYYILYSDPNCGYCTTGTSYKTATSPLGPWVGGTKISINSCGGQPSFVSMLKMEDEIIFLYGSDLWNNGAANEALANYFWAPLKFAPNGSIYPIVCEAKVTLPIKEEIIEKILPEDLDNTSGIEGFTTYCDISAEYQRGQSFVATRSGTLTAVSFMTAKSGSPTSGLTIEIYKSANDFTPTGNALSSQTVPAELIGWAPKFVTVNPNILVEAGVRYTMIVKTASTSAGRYGLQYNDSAPYPGGGAIYSSTRGTRFVYETNRTLMFQTFVRSNTNGEMSIYDSQTDTYAYPNPVERELNISLVGITRCSEVKIFDNAGKEVLLQNITDFNKKNVIVDVSSLRRGAYIVKLENEGMSQRALKILKQ